MRTLLPAVLAGVLVLALTACDKPAREKMGEPVPEQPVPGRLPERTDTDPEDMSEEAEERAAEEAASRIPDEEIPAEASHAEHRDEDEAGR